MMQRTALDDAIEDIINVCLLEHAIAVTMEFDKSDSDFVRTRRVCNWAHSNATIYV